MHRSTIRHLLRPFGRKAGSVCLFAAIVAIVSTGFAAPNIAPILHLLLDGITLDDLAPANFTRIPSNWEYDLAIHEEAYLGQLIRFDENDPYDIIIGGAGDTSGGPDDDPPTPYVVSDNVTFIPGVVPAQGTDPLLSDTLPFNEADRVTSQTGAYKSRGFCAADFDGDNRIDIVTSSSGANSEVPSDLGPGESIRVIMDNNTDNGTFVDIAEQQILTGYPGARGIVVEDYDHHTGLDIIFTIGGRDSIGILTNDGTNDFEGVGDATEYLSGTNAKYLSAGDLNGDGWVDFAVPSDTAEVYVHMNNGGTISDGVPVPVASKSEYTHIADINNDGYDDILVSHPDDTGFVGGFSVIKSNGEDGTFQPYTPYLNLGNARHIKTGDFNRDGHIDIVVAVYFENAGPKQERLVIMLNKGDGTFLEAASLDSFNISGLDIADINGDDWLDIMQTIIGRSDGMGNPGTSQKLIFYFGTP